MVYAVSTLSNVITSNCLARHIGSHKRAFCMHGEIFNDMTIIGYGKNKFHIPSFGKGARH